MAAHFPRGYRTEALTGHPSEELLGDATRPGAPCKFTPEQVAQILAVACEPPRTVVSPERVVRERQPDDPRCGKLVVFSLEGELFFGAAPELDEYLAELTRRPTSCSATTCASPARAGTTPTRTGRGGIT